MTEAQKHPDDDGQNQQNAGTGSAITMTFRTVINPAGMIEDSICEGAASAMAHTAILSVCCRVAGAHADSAACDIICTTIMA